jgi:hypothetical protein
MSDLQTPRDRDDDELNLDRWSEEIESLLSEFGEVALDADFSVTKRLPDRVFYRGYPLAEPADNLDDPDRATAAEKRVADSLARLLD